MFEVQSAELRNFRFAVGGKEYEIPLLRYLPYDKVRGLRDARKDGDGFDIADWYISEIFEHYAPGCTANLTYGQIEGLLMAYDTACGTGE